MALDNPLVESTTERVAPPAVLVVFGASGDLTARKLVPAVEQLALRHLLPGGFSLVGVARTPMTDAEFEARVRADAEKNSGSGPETQHVWDGLTGTGDGSGGTGDATGDGGKPTSGLRYVAGDYGDPDTYRRLGAVLEELDRLRGSAGNRLYYLATPASAFGPVVEGLGAAGLNRPVSDGAFVRIVIEKPYGRDQRSARDLDDTVHGVFDESQVYRIDHYLGKETVQNTLALRFANAIFEPIWNRRYVDHVQVTVAESLGVEYRGAFYEQAGALRDIVQNHVMQVLALTLMEPPATFHPNAIRDEKVKVLRAVSGFEGEVGRTDVVRAQYGSGWVGGVEVPPYREEAGVDPHSQRDTYVAMRLEVDNWRWAGVPIYVRTGKRLPKRVTEVAMEFKAVPHLPFARSQAEGLEPGALVLRIQPDEGITLRFGAKVPGQAFRVRSVSMDFFYGAAFMEETPEAYERLLLDALLGDPTLFIRADEVGEAWRICDPILSAWEDDAVPLARYEAGSWGPAEADALIGRDGRRWRNP